MQFGRLFAHWVQHLKENRCLDEAIPEVTDYFHYPSHLGRSQYSW